MESFLNTIIIASTHNQLKLLSTIYNGLTMLAISVFYRIYIDALSNNNNNASKMLQNNYTQTMNN